jgi:hypothetical protein
VGSLLLCAEAFSNRLEIVEDINGHRFPFHFPFRTERWFGRMESPGGRATRLRLWSGVETSRGEGENVSGFENRLWFRRYTMGGSLGYRLRPENPRQRVARLRPGSGLPGVRLRVTHHMGNGDVGMYFNGTRYLHLQDLNTRFTTVRLDVVPFRNMSIFGGWQRLGMAQDGQSFFDPWPFIVWDVFVAKRYRLDDAAVQLDTWYAGLGKVWQSKRFELELSGRFEWLRDTGGLDLLERVDILFPFFFRYDRTDKAIDIPFRYAVQFDPSFSWRPSRNVMLRLFGRATVPFGKEATATSESTDDPGGGNAAPPLSDDGTTHGGLTGFVEIIYSL